MAGIQLVRLDPSLEGAIARNPDYLHALTEDNWPLVAQVVHQVVGRILVATPISVDDLQWGGYFVVDQATREVVGSCAFKTPPTKEGTVEIAYFTYPEFEGRGYATMMARKLIDLARGSAEIRRIVAHTLPEENASTRVLEKAGMTFVGEVMDPHDGRVWQWDVRVGS